MRHDRKSAKLVAEMGDKISVDEKFVPKKKTYNEEDKNDFKDLVAILYNIMMIALWFSFAFCVFNEYNTHGYNLMAKHPRKYMSVSITMLKICQAGQWVNLLLALVGVSKTAIL